MSIVSEKQKNPRTPNKEPNYTLRRWVAGGIAGSALFSLGMGAEYAASHIAASDKLDGQLTSSSALTDYKEGKIDLSKTVVIKVPESATAWDTAREIKNPDTDTRELSDELSAQDGNDGVQAGEEFVVKRSQIDPQKLNELAVRESVEPPLPGEGK